MKHFPSHIQFQNIQTCHNKRVTACMQVHTDICWIDKILTQICIFDKAEIL